MTVYVSRKYLMQQLLLLVFNKVVFLRSPIINNNSMCQYPIGHNKENENNCWPTCKTNNEISIRRPIFVTCVRCKRVKSLSITGLN